MFYLASSLILGFITVTFKVLIFTYKSFCRHLQYFDII